MTSRRDFLRDFSLGIAAAVPSLSRISWAAAEREIVETGPLIKGKDRMVVRSFRFIDLEMPGEFANSWITPVSHFYVRNHVFQPAPVNGREWKLAVQGEVQRPLVLSLSDLARLNGHSVTNTLECAGNGRAFQNPKVAGIQWQRGAVGTARFSGPRLGQILERAGVKSTGKHVMFRGLDQAPGKVPPFIRSIPIEKALDPDTLLATHMNGAPLSDYHGFPARALVPGWVGAASVKWVSEIRVLEKEFDGNFMKPGYRLPNRPVQPGDVVNPEDTHALTTLSVKSIIAAPGEGARLNLSPVRICGAAWAGEADVRKVEISTDGGRSWALAMLGKDQEHYAWRLWSYDWMPKEAGEYVICSRASDDQGRVQPEIAVWNPSGYLYNAVDRVKVHVI
ncbi:MAG: sulfite oxidase [Acidobacteria bacterium]|nr:sulfite oxidase [Acidobacteriota bacterium]